MRGWPQTWLVMLTVPFAVAGSTWLLALLDHNLSTAVWVGLIAVGGVAPGPGSWSWPTLTLMVLPAAYAIWRRWQFARRPLAVAVQ